MALLVIGMIGARTVNLAHLACERGSALAELASTYRRLQRFFQHVALAEDWRGAAGCEFAGGAGKRTW